MFDKENLRQISIEGCKMIGSGAHSKVYRIAPDEIVKVYREDIPFSKIQLEKEKSRRALILGLPTAISFDIVKVGSCYGAVYELIDAESTAGFIGRSRENLDRYIMRGKVILPSLGKDFFTSVGNQFFTWGVRTDSWTAGDGGRRRRIRACSHTISE